MKDLPVNPGAVFLLINSGPGPATGITILFSGLAGLDTTVFASGSAPFSGDGGSSCNTGTASSLAFSSNEIVLCGTTTPFSSSIFPSTLKSPISSHTSRGDGQ